MSAELVRLSLPYPKLSGNNANRQGLGRVYKRDDARAYELEVRRRVVTSRYADTTIDEPVELEIHAWPPDRKARDQTNVCKPLEDALVRAQLLAQDSNAMIKKTIFLWHDFCAEEKSGLIIVIVRKFVRSDHSSGT